ncbi:hypothetical protein KEM60_01458 [Austwickia sp. TVS 96-490-7B]|uniref:malectin domain-containing carbohydrate-binding protein n=1 Tax=Austwickia sp. TVS 96-490-7B TaxID=2830843 RepID=UPI001C57C4B9|nr:malectin domain-containing carbohydrate-binding protein [Austwickia sp. TVS 96-490-7B]MBW3085261.1 hypothetical protein [Austwickia sp. TVS 96-490-7B]
MALSYRRALTSSSVLVVLLGAGLAAVPASAADPAPVTLEPLVAGSTCSYLNPKAAPPQGWSGVSVDESGWSKGALPMGHQEKVATDIGIPAKTTYHRCAFTIPASHTAQSATINVRVDDGAVLYLNGVELARTNMPSGPVGFDTSASGVDTWDGTRWQSWTVPASALRAGVNVLAVEVHQSFTGTWISSDSTFDAKVSVVATPVAAPVPDVSASGFPFRMVAGDKAVVDSAGKTWSAQSGFVGGKLSTPYAGDIAGTTEDALYRPVRYGMTAWKRAVPNGLYDVTLKMQENYWNAPKKRVFDVTAEGALALADVDVYATVGKNAAYDRTFRVQVTDGQLDLGFVAKTDLPTVSAIVINTPPSATPAPAGWKLFYADEFNGTALDTTRWQAYHNTYGDSDPGMLQCLTPNNVSVSAGTMKITAKKEKVTCPNGTVWNYSSGFLGTRDVKRYYPLFGRYEIRARIPNGQGLYPGFWLRHRKGSSTAEVDIQENFYSQNPGGTTSTVHFPTSLGYNVAKKATKYETPVVGRGGWHTFSVDILPVTAGDYSKVRFVFKIDGATTLDWINTKATAFTSDDRNATWDMALQLNVGGIWVGHPEQKLGWMAADGGRCSLNYKAMPEKDAAKCPTTNLAFAPWRDASYEIDYVRVYTPA